MKPKKDLKGLPFELQKRILISFNHSVAVVVDGRFIMTNCAVCEEVFQGKMTISEKETPAKKEASPAEIPVSAKEAMTVDFPMFFKVLSMGDGKPLRVPCDIMVKWNNISAICELRPDHE